MNEYQALMEWYLLTMKKNVVVWDSGERPKRIPGLRDKLRRQDKDLEELGFKVTGLSLPEKEFNAIIAEAGEDYKMVKDWHYTSRSGFNIFRGSTAHFHV